MKTNYTNIADSHKQKSTLLLILLLLGFFIIIIRLFQVQVIDHDKYQALYKRQGREKINVYAKRGCIYDRNYKVLAKNTGVKYTFGINLNKVKDKVGLAKRLASVTDQKKEKYYRSKIKGAKGFKWIAHDLKSSQKEEILKILTKDESAVSSFKATPSRAYPMKEVGAQILGFTDLEGEGVMGIESTMEKFLKGEDGFEFVYKDAKDNLSYHRGRKKDPINGNNVVLTIDAESQQIVEDELEKAVKKWKAKKGTAVVLSPKTGEILALSSYPSFDPNCYFDFSAGERKNKAITDIYEPGSTIKSISAAMLLEEGKVKETDVFFCDNKGVKILPNRRPIKDSHKNKNEYLTFNQVLAKSSNVGIVKAVSKLSDKKFYEYLRSFGFGYKTDIDLTGEVSGILPPKKNWSAFSKPTMSFGQGMSATILQVAMAYGALANGGTLLKPMLVKGIVAEDGHIIKKNEPDTIRQVISKKTAARVRKMLSAVVEEGGTAKEAYIENLNVCGKTGTSQKVINGNYSRRYYDASFAGMLPYQNPEIVCVVVIDSPKPYHWGGMVAGSVFKKIISRIYQKKYSQLTTKNDGKKRIIIPNLIDMESDLARKILNTKKIPFKIDKEGVISYQSLRAYSYKKDSDTLLLSTLKTKSDLSPDAIGLSLREGVKMMHERGLEVVVKGEGNVYKQQLNPSIKPEITSVCTLYCHSLLEENKAKKQELAKKIREMKRKLKKNRKLTVEA